MLEAGPVRPVVRVRDVWVEYSLAASPLRSRKRIHALRGASFDVLEKETYGIVGASGSGKSTLLKVVMGFVRPSKGSVEIDGIDLYNADGRTRKNIVKRLGYVSQNPLAAVDPRYRVRDIIAEPLRASGVPKREVSRILPALLEMVDLDPDVIDLLPHELSLGMLQRVVIARAIAVKPRVLLLDEPTSALDTVTQSHIVSLLGELKELFGYTSILVSHDLKVVSHLANRLAIMMAGLILEEGPTSEVLESPLHPYTRELVDSMKLKEVGEVFITDPSACPFYAHCPRRLEERCRELPLLTEVGSSRRVRCWLYV